MISVEKNENGKDIITLENENLTVKMTNWGCRILSIIMDDCHHQKGDIVLGYDNFEDYEKDTGTYFGALVGRVANRIGKGTFDLNGKTYHLAINNGPNSLHGGLSGFDRKLFDYEISDNQVIFTTLSPNKEEGYPGDLILIVTYTLNDHSLTMHYQAASNQDTLINLTNHSYFNLASHPGLIDDHILCVDSDIFNHVDGDGLAINEQEEVEGTPFDFREPKRIGDMMYRDHSQLKTAKGYDHHFIFNQDKDQVVLYEPHTKRKLTVSTTLPGAQIYSANYLDGMMGKYHETYFEKYALCIETQNLPDAIHLEEHPSTLLKKGTWYDESTTYTFEVVK